MCRTTNLKPYLYVFIIFILTFNAGCRSHTAYVYSAVDPSYSPSKTDSIWFTLPEKPTIKERQLAPVIKREFKEKGFNIIDNINDSRWTMVLASERKTFDYGFSNNITTYNITPRLAVSSSNSQRVLVDKTIIYLYLFDSNDYKNGKALSIWEGSVSATQNVYNAYTYAMLSNLLDKFGVNYERLTKLGRDYTNKDIEGQR